MKNTPPALQSSLARTKVLFSQSQSMITNASGIWWPGTVIPSDVRGLSGVNISLATTNGSWLKAGVFRASSGILGLLMGYGSMERKVITQAQPMPKGDYVYLEIDLDPQTSQVTFWVNDTGMDMGILPGFIGGAQHVSWSAEATHDGQLLNGKFSDCALATAAGGWSPSILRKSDSKHVNLRVHHTVNLLSHDSFSFDDWRSTSRFR